VQSFEVLSLTPKSVSVCRHVHNDNSLEPHVNHSTPEQLRSRKKFNPRAVPTEVSHRHNTRSFDGRNNVDE